GTVRLWDMSTRQQIGRPLTGHTDAVVAAAFSPDGKSLATGSYDGTIRLWNVSTHRQIGRTLNGHAGEVTRWRSALAARSWPSAAPTARCGCGMCPPASGSGTPSPATPARS